MTKVNSIFLQKISPELIAYVFKTRLEVFGKISILYITNEELINEEDVLALLKNIISTFIYLESSRHLIVKSDLFLKTNQLIIFKIRVNINFKDSNCKKCQKVLWRYKIVTIFSMIAGVFMQEFIKNVLRVILDYLFF